jgi:hypothetical protein
MFPKFFAQSFLNKHTVGHVVCLPTYLSVTILVKFSSGMAVMCRFYSPMANYENSTTYRQNKDSKQGTNETATDKTNKSILKDLISTSFSKILIIVSNLSVVVCLLEVSDSLQTEFAEVVQLAVGGHFEGRNYVMKKNKKIILVMMMMMIIVIIIIVLIHKTVHP